MHKPSWCSIVLKAILVLEFSTFCYTSNSVEFQHGIKYVFLPWGLYVCRRINSILSLINVIKNKLNDHLPCVEHLIATVKRKTGQLNSVKIQIVTILLKIDLLSSTVFHK